MQPSESNSDPRSLLSDWVDEHADALYRFALARVGDEHAIEDLLQDTYLAAVKAYPGFRGEASVRTWLIAILRLKIYDYHRQQAKSAQAEQRLEHPPSFQRTERLQAWNYEASQTVEREEFWKVLRSCVSKLPESVAKAFILRELDGFSGDLICNTLNISKRNLAVRLFRARGLLRDCLDQNWFDGEGA